MAEPRSHRRLPAALETRARSSGQRGQATTEYVILLVAVAIVCIGILIAYGNRIRELWEGGTLAAEGVQTAADDAIAEADAAAEAACPYRFNSSTGRWHDPETNLFVSFENAESSGCGSGLP